VASHLLIVVAEAEHLIEIHDQEKSTELKIIAVLLWER